MDKMGRGTSDNESGVDLRERRIASPNGVVGVSGLARVGVDAPQFVDPGDPGGEQPSRRGGSIDGQSLDESSCTSLCWSVNRPTTASPYHHPPPSYEETRASDALAASRALQQSLAAPTSPPQGAFQGAPQGPVILHKSTKALYRAVAAQWGIACKMTDHCRCLDCQSHYFDCDYDLNEHDKTDGGLAAGTPIFISEVIHGSACTIL